MGRNIQRGNAGMKKKVITLVCVAVAALILIGIVFWIDYRRNREILKLGQYKGLDVDCGIAEPEDAVAAAVVERTKFGPALGKAIETEFQNAIESYEAEAKQYNMTLSEYVDTFFERSEEQFREIVRSETEKTLKEEAVLLLIAEKENIEFSDRELDEALPMIMEEYGYWDMQAFYKNVDIESVRKELLLEKVRVYLTEQNHILNAPSKE